jgi:hypothetical protein
MNLCSVGETPLLKVLLTHKHLSVMSRVTIAGDSPL